MKTWMYGAAGRIPQKLSVFAVGLCCLLFMPAGPAGAQTANIGSLQSQIDALQKQVDALKAALAAQAAQPAPAATTRRPSPLPRRAAG